MTDQAAGHSFISYVREDRDRVAAIESALRAADIPVWTDKTKLTPGQDWKVVIRQAIQRNALAFVAVFSSNSQSRDASYQNEELVLAAEQFRKHPPGRVWLIPVRLDDCELPDFDLGAGRTLDSLQRVDLFGDEADDEKIRLVSAVLRILGDQAPDSATIKALVSQSDSEHRGPTLANAVKTMVLEPRRRIELEELVRAEADRAHANLTDVALFPDSASLDASAECTRAMGTRYNAYFDAVLPLAHALVAGCAWAEPDNFGPWTQAIRRIASIVDAPRGGNSYLLAMQHYPTTVLMYAGALAALSRRNFGTLRAVTIEPTTRYNSERVAAVNAASPAEYEQAFRPAANLIAVEADGLEPSDDEIQAWFIRRGMRHTPISDHLFRRLRPLFAGLVPDDADYEDLFDEAEVLLGTLASDTYLRTKGGGAIAGYPWFGRFTWRHRHSHLPVHRRIQAEFVEQGAAWPPLKAGMFGGSVERAAAAFEYFADRSDEVMKSRW